MSRDDDDYEVHTILSLIPSIPSDASGLRGGAEPAALLAPGRRVAATAQRVL